MRGIRLSVLRSRVWLRAAELAVTIGYLEQGLDESDVEGRDAAAQRAEVKAGSGP